MLIQSVFNEEGRYVYERSPEGELLKEYFEYFIKDHLGNNRVRFADLNNDGKIQVINSNNEIDELLSSYHYYPFGMVMEGTWRNSSGEENRYQYNGKEVVKEFGFDWIDYGARWYDPAIGRWHSIDPLAEIYATISPYHYALNNPIVNIDPNGMNSTNVIEDAWNGSGDGITIWTNNNNGTFSDGNGNTIGKKNSKEEECCPDGGIEWRSHNRAKRFYEGKINKEEYITEMQSEWEGAKDGALWIMGEWAIVRVFQAGKWGYRWYKIRNVKGLYGGVLKSTAGKTTTILGKFDPQIGKILKTQGSKVGANPGGFNVLNINNWTGLKNVQWLDDAVLRGDVIRVVTDPAKATGVYADELLYLKNQYNMIPDANGIMKIITN